jgi:hypothetical protein
MGQFPTSRITSHIPNGLWYLSGYGATIEADRKERKAAGTEDGEEVVGPTSQIIDKIRSRLAY